MDLLIVIVQKCHLVATKVGHYVTVRGLRWKYNVYGAHRYIMGRP